MLQMVQQMRRSLLDESEQPEGFGGSTMQETFDSEFSRYLAQSGGVGLGAFMTRTLDARASDAVSPAAAAASPVSFALPPAERRRCRRRRTSRPPRGESVHRQRRRSGVGRTCR